MQLYSYISNLIKLSPYDITVYEFQVHYIITQRNHMQDSAVQPHRIVRPHQQTNSVSKLVWIQSLSTDADRPPHKVTQHTTLSPTHSFAVLLATDYMETL